MGDEVEIGKQVNYKTLETALVKAAEEIGWKAKVQDKFERNYKLGSVQKTQDYDYTMINLRGRVFPAMKVKIYISDKSPTNRFFVWQGFFQHGCLASERKIRKYLSAVSRNL